MHVQTLCNRSEPPVYNTMNLVDHGKWFGDKSTESTSTPKRWHMRVRGGRGVKLSSCFKALKFTMKSDLASLVETEVPGEFGPTNPSKAAGVTAARAGWLLYLFTLQKVSIS